MLLDIHPEPRNSSIEVRSGEGSISAGELDESSLIELILTARRVLDSWVTSGFFVPETEKKFDSLYRYDDVDLWQKEIEEDWSHAQLSPDIVARVRELMSKGDSYVRMREPARAVRFKRLP